MSGSTARTGPEWVRDTDKRVTNLERAGVIHIGSWALWEDETGRLVAGKDGRTVVLADVTAQVDERTNPT